MANPLKVALVGAGSISRAWLDGCKTIDGLDFVAVVDIIEESARKRVEEYQLGDVLIDSDLDRVLNQTKPDVVFNCTVPEAHYPVTMTALAHGCHVLGEKPLADSMENARRMVDAAAEADRLFAVIQNRRFHPGNRRFSRFLESEALGPLTTLNSDFYIGAHFGGFRDHMKNVLLLDMAIHTFDAARLISGADPISVYCKEWNPAGSWYDQDASAVAIFEMSNGIVYTYRGSWCAEGMNTSWECEWRAIGQRGSVLWDGRETFRAQVVAKTGAFFSEWDEVEVPPLDPSDKIGGHGGQIADFVDCVRSGRIPETQAADNIKSLAMVFGAIESAKTNTVHQIEVDG